MQREESCEDQEREVRQGLDRKGLDARDAVVIHDRAESGTKTNRSEFERLRLMIDEVKSASWPSTTSRGSAGPTTPSTSSRIWSTWAVASSPPARTSTPTRRAGSSASRSWSCTTARRSGSSAGASIAARRAASSTTAPPATTRSATSPTILDPNWAEASRRGPKPKKGLRVYEPEARWVRQVFDWFADERWSIAEIARELTRLGVDKGIKGTAPGWHHAQVRRMLANEKYAGRWVWGASKSVRNSEGKVKRVPLPPDQWVVRDREELRIVDAATWDRARRRLARARRPLRPEGGPEPARGQAASHRGLPEEPARRPGLTATPAARGSGCEGASTATSTSAARTTPRGPARWPARSPSSGPSGPCSEFTTELLTSWPPWLEAAAAAMRAGRGRGCRPASRGVAGGREPPGRTPPAGSTTWSTSWPRALSRARRFVADSTNWSERPRSCSSGSRRGGEPSEPPWRCPTTTGSGPSFPSCPPCSATTTARRLPCSAACWAG